MKQKLFPSSKISSIPGFFPLLFILATVFISEGVMAQGDLLINPKRLVFDGRGRSQEVTLANIGKDTARYVVSFTQVRMKEDGNFEQITEPDPGQNFADKYLRIFPRSVTLAPGEAQIVKVQISQYDKTTTGEYRSHLYFRAVQTERPLGETVLDAEPAQLSVRLTAVFGISIPVIIRKGESTAAVTISDVQLEIDSGASPFLKMRFNRTGNMSVYGDLAVEHITPEGKVTRAGLIKGISVYTPNLARDIKITLDSTAGINYKRGKLRVIYSSSSDSKSERLAAAELTLSD